MNYTLWSKCYTYIRTTLHCAVYYNFMSCNWYQLQNTVTDNKV